MDTHACLNIADGKSSIVYYSDLQLRSLKYITIRYVFTSDLFPGYYVRYSCRYNDPHCKFCGDGREKIKSMGSFANRVTGSYVRDGYYESRGIQQRYIWVKYIDDQMVDITLDDLIFKVGKHTFSDELQTQMDTYLAQ